MVQDALYAAVRRPTERRPVTGEIDWAAEIIRTEPPGNAIHGIRASHKVPFGRVFRQWDTDGKLWCWCNRGEIADLPQGSRPNVFNANWTTLDLSAIPIYNRD